MQLKAAYKNNNNWIDVTIAEIEGFKDNDSYCIDYDRIILIGGKIHE